MRTGAATAFASQVVSDAVTGAFSCAALDTSAHYALTLDGEVAEYDPYWSNVVLAMHMDDVGLADEKRHAVTLSVRRTVEYTKCVRRRVLGVF